MFYLDTGKTYPSRFDLSKFIGFDEGVFDIVQSYVLSEIRKLPMDQIYVVRGKSRRPDLISYEVYGSTTYWWIVLAYNDIDTVDRIQEGSRLGMPSLASLDRLYFQLGNLKSLRGQ